MERCSATTFEQVWSDIAVVSEHRRTIGRSTDFTAGRGRCANASLRTAAAASEQRAISATRPGKRTNIACESSARSRRTSFPGLDALQNEVLGWRSNAAHRNTGG